MNVLVVDDEIKIANAMTERLRLRGFEASAAFDAETALNVLEAGVFQGMILDLRLPDLNGLEVLKRVHHRYPTIRVVILSGHGSDREFDACRASGAVACFHKPTDIAVLIEALVSEDDRVGEHQA